MNQNFFRLVKKMFLLLFFFSLSFPVFAQTDKGFQLSTSSVELTPGGSAEITVDVYIPNNQHLYVKKASALSFNNPTVFSSKTKGFDVAIKEEPTSQQKGEDFILAGQGSSKAGTYVLTVYETLGRGATKKPLDLSLAITTQWCNSQTDQCFQPKTLTKKLKVSVKGEKNISMAMTKSRASGGVAWIQKFNDAKSKATSSKQNIFVIITAPTWCGYCIVLERDVFAKENVIKTLNSKFVPLQILDSNSDQNQFSFSGYPTMFMLDSKGKKIAEINARNETSFLAAIQKYEVTGGGGGDSPSEDSSPTTFNYSIKISGKFSKNSDGTWNHSENSGTTKLVEYSRDQNYIILQKQGENQFYALPQRGKKAYYLKNNKWELLELE